MIQLVEADLLGLGRCSVYEVEYRGGVVRVVPGSDLAGVWVHRGTRLERFVPAEDPELAEVLLGCGFSL